MKALCDPRGLPFWELVESITRVVIWGRWGGGSGLEGSEAHSVWMDF